MSCGRGWSRCGSSYRCGRGWNRRSGGGGGWDRCGEGCGWGGRGRNKCGGDRDSCGRGYTTHILGKLGPQCVRDGATDVLMLVILSLIGFKVTVVATVLVLQLASSPPAAAVARHAPRAGVVGCGGLVVGVGAGGRGWGGGASILSFPHPGHCRQEAPVRYPALPHHHGHHILKQQQQYRLSNVRFTNSIHYNTHTKHTNVKKKDN